VGLKSWSVFLKLFFSSQGKVFAVFDECTISGATHQNSKKYHLYFSPSLSVMKWFIGLF
jgi:hypothetical protein